MDLETVQLLNLSPIPELSEMELSTMLDQLSNLSDLNGDLTDRNVEDILKEAEDLLDKSSCSLPYDNRINTQNSEKMIKNMIEENETLINDKEERCKNKNDDSSSELLSSKALSPGSSTNLIKSTIDSLKEYSSLMEKKISNQSSSPKSEQKHSDQDSSVAKSSPKSAKIKNLSETNKSSNCFERLYQDKPTRLSGTCITHKKAKIDKVPKTLVKKKFAKDFRTSIGAFSIKDKIQSKSCVIRKTTQDLKPRSTQRVPQVNKTFSSEKFTSSSFSEDEPQRDVCGSNALHIDLSSKTNPEIDEVIQKLLSEMEEIKDQVKKSGMVANAKDSERILKESLAVIDNLRSEMEFMRTKVCSESSQNEGIKRLEEQFTFLKNKYDHQMEKLEMENLKLKEALNNQQKLLTPQVTSNTDVSTNVDFPINNLPSFVSPSFSSGTMPSRTVSQENYKAPHNTPCSGINFSNDYGSSEIREASSQTEKNVCNASTQCIQVDTHLMETENKTLIIPTRRIENKENLKNKKLTKPKPFSDVNLLKQKKSMSDHETQLMATLRGLQAELLAKDRETRKLKTEMDVLKGQIRRLTRGKVEVVKRTHVGTQTIGLGPVVQKPYNPEAYEVPGEYEKENEELKSRIKSLEESFELLKEKRIADLQSLHRVHEEEMAKLVSKLETQSALTKHLHSLLVNR